MIDLVRASKMEVLKLRRTLALWASILVPLLVIAMTTALNLSRNIGGRFDPGAPPTVVPWDAFMLTPWHPQMPTRRRHLPFRLKPGKDLHTLADNAVQLMKAGYSKGEAMAAVLNTAGVSTADTGRARRGQQPSPVSAGLVNSPTRRAPSRELAAYVRVNDRARTAREADFTFAELFRVMCQLSHSASATSRADHVKIASSWRNRPASSVWLRAPVRSG
jgi:hypothetical protein